VIFVTVLRTVKQQKMVSKFKRICKNKRKSIS